jgi:hypothetical protein
MAIANPMRQSAVDGRYEHQMRPCLRCGKPFLTTCRVRICEACHRLTDHVRNPRKVCVADSTAG